MCGQDPLPKRGHALQACLMRLMRLRISRHRVGFIQYDELIRWWSIRSGASRNSHLGKRLDLVANHSDPTLVGRVELHDARSVFAAKKMTCSSEDCGGFSGARRAVENEMRQLRTWSALVRSHDEWRTLTHAHLHSFAQWRVGASRSLRIGATHRPHS